MSSHIAPDQPMAPLIVEPLEGPSHADSAFIFLHGFGDEGSSYQNLADQIQKAKVLPRTRFIFPTADWSKDAGERAWYPPGSVEDRDPTGEISDYEAALKIVDGLIDAQLSCGIQRSKIILGGFSQGGAITSLWSILRQTSPSKRIAGLVIIASYIPMRAKFVEMAKQAVNQADSDIKDEYPWKDQPLVMLHGQNDGLVQTWVAKESIPIFEELGFEVNWALLPGMAHDVNGQTISMLVQFLQSVLIG